MSEAYATRLVIASSLGADSQIAAIVGTRIFFGVKPEGDALPAIVFSQLGGEDSQTVDGNRIFANPVFYIKGMGQDDVISAKLASYIDRVISALNYTPVTWDGHDYVVQVARRNAESQFVESRDGLEYYHNGGNYRFETLRIGQTP